VLKRYGGRGWRGSEDMRRWRKENFNDKTEDKEKKRKREEEKEL